MANVKTLSFQANNYTIRRETLDNRQYIVVPVIMMVEGVHNGSAGPILHMAEEFGKIPEAWNDISIPILHPQEGSNYVSASSPQIIERQTVGRIYNTRVDNGKLKAECWIDEAKIKQISPATLARIMNQQPLDVSVGVFTDDDFTSGTWNGESYTAIARNHRPDHLALLPGETGACSFDDGCGIRANQEKGGNNVEVLIKRMKTLAMEGYSVVQINEIGFRETGEKIQTKLDAMDTDVKWHFLTEIFDDEFVFEVRTEGVGSTFFQRGYQVNTDESVEFTGEPVQVVKKVNFVEVQSNTQKGGVKTMAKEKDKQPCCPEQVKLIIQSEHTRYGEDDRPFLEGLEKEQLLKALPIEPKEAPAVNTQATEDLTKEKAIEVLKESLANKDGFMKLVSPELRANLEHGEKLLNAERERLIKHITTNQASEVFKAEELAGKSTAELTKLASLVKAPVDYSVLNGGSSASEDDKAGKLPPPGVIDDSGK